MKKGFPVLLVLLISAPHADATYSIEPAFMSYENTLRSQYSYGLNLGYLHEGDRVGYGMKLSALTRSVKEKDLTSSLVRTLLNNKSSYEQQSVSGGPSFTWDRLYTLSVSVGTLKSPIDRTLSYGLTLSGWVLQETLEVKADYQHSKMKQKEQTFYDVNADLVFLPTLVSGDSYTLSLRHLTTPSTALQGQYSIINRTDRPRAEVSSFEVRQLIKPTASAVIASIGHFENIGRLTKESSYHSLSANSAMLTLKQALVPDEKKAIAEISYRYYEETAKSSEFLRDADPLHSALTTVSLRSMLDEGPWALQKNEAYLFVGHYEAKGLTHGYLYGAGFRFDLL
jgi:hypothetical protein